MYAIQDTKGNFKEKHHGNKYFTISLAIIIFICVATLEFKLVPSIYSKRGEEESWRSGRFIYQEHTDRNLHPNNCFDLLQKHRQGFISQTKVSSQTYPIGRSYVARTNTQNPFHISLHDGKIDSIRMSIFDSGKYYEHLMTEVVAEIFNDESRKKVKPVMLDVGANIGWFSLLAASHGAEVFAFEPNVINMVRFCESQILNGWSTRNQPESQNQIHSYLAGIGREHGQLLKMFKLDPTNPGASTLNQEFASKSGVLNEVDGAEILIVTLDRLAKDQGWLDEESDVEISLMKIDVEGGERSALEGAKEFLQSHIVKNILIELNKDALRSDLEGVISILFQSGYTLFKIGEASGPKRVVTKEYDSPGALIDDQIGGNKNAWFKIKY